MRPKSEISNFELLVPSKGIFYFRKYGTDEKVSAIDSLRYFNSRKAEQFKKDLLLRKSTAFTAYWKTVCDVLEEYDTWSQVFNQTSEVRATSVFCMIERAAEKLPREKA